MLFSFFNQSKAKQKQIMTAYARFHAFGLGCLFFLPVLIGWLRQGWFLCSTQTPIEELLRTSICTVTQALALQQFTWTYVCACVPLHVNWTQPLLEICVCGDWRTSVQWTRRTAMKETRKLLTPLWKHNYAFKVVHAQTQTRLKRGLVLSPAKMQPADHMSMDVE